MATKTGRGVVESRGVPLALLMAGLKRRQVEWCEQIGKNSILKTGTFEGVKGKRMIVRDTSKFDRVVMLPIGQPIPVIG